MVWPLQKDMAAYFGDVDANDDGLPDPAWQAANLVRVVPPWDMGLAWAPAKRLKSIAIHKLCAASLTVILTNIWDDVGQSQKVIEDAGLHLFGGCFNFRMTRGGTRLSTHAYAAAIDLDPERNPLGKAWVAESGMMPMRVVERFEEQSWRWGGRFSRPDCMHFDAVRS